jgi:hypothetical protein
MKNLNLKIQSKLDEQIDLISNSEYLNRQESIEYLQRQLNYLYQEELELEYQFGIENSTN